MSLPPLSAMTDLSAEFKALADYRPTNKVRFVTAASLFDGHDAAINMVRRLLQAHGAEVVHLGHNRSVAEIVAAAIQEDADAVGLSVLSGAHMTLFRKVIELLHDRGADDMVVFGGGIIPDADIPELTSMGVAKIFTPGATTQSIVDWVRAHVPTAVA